MAKSFFKSSSIKNIDTAFLKNRALLYIVFLLALGNVYYMMMDNNITFLMIFIIIGFLTSFFSRNMVVILSIAMTFTHILKYGANVYKLEGFEGETPEPEMEEVEGMADEEEEQPDSDVVLSESFDSSGNAMGELLGYNIDSNPGDSELSLSSILPTLAQTQSTQEKILSKINGIEKFTNGLSEYIN